MRWLTDNSRKFLERGYLESGETPEQRIMDIAQYAEKVLGEEGFANKFYDYMSRGWFSLSSPIWANFGKERGLPISCFTSYLDDDMANILYTNAEVGMMSKYGGGTAGYFGDLRERGASIKGNGKSSGPVHFMQMFNSNIDVVSQGSVRRGSFAAYLPVEHPDIMEFLEIRTEGNPIQSLNFGVTVTDKWMKEMEKGDREKRKIWARVIKSRNETGMPYIFFTDNVNNNTVDVYKDKSLKIHSSNLCVKGDTKILTDTGYEDISTCVGYKIIWNGYKWSLANIQKTGEEQTLVRVSTNLGYIDCTLYHKFPVKNDCGAVLRIPAYDLKVGDVIADYKTPKGFGDENIEGLQITSIKEIKGLHDTYCFREPENSTGVLNGVLTGNCSEIALPTNKHWSFVCDLSSMNLVYYDEWKDTDAVKVLTYFLDAVMSDFIEKIEKLPEQPRTFMERAYNFAVANRALGIGVFGWHTYLQNNMIPFEDIKAYEINKEIWENIKEKSYKASAELADKLGEPEVLKGYGRRNSTLMAIAPTTSSAFIIGQASQSIEPLMSNYYVKDLAKSKVTIKNPRLKKLLAEKGEDNKDTWKSIMDNDGSVQHLDFLSTNEKNVFKTFSEINQYAIIDQAADRQKFIDQAQSLNLMVSPETPVKDINALYIDAWKQGVKTLYYQHSKSAAQELRRKIQCSGCEA